jgi:hypothetical protein
MELFCYLSNFPEAMGAKKDPKKDAKAPTKTPKKKEGGGGGKAKKKKWSKGKSRDKLNNLVLFDKVFLFWILLDEFYRPNITQMPFSVSFLFRPIYVILQLFFSRLSFRIRIKSGQ